MTKEPVCYGKMFPDLMSLQMNRPLQGRVFSALVESCGVAVQRRTVNVNDEEWKKCRDCEHYRTCYDLGLGRMVLAIGVCAGL